LTVTPNGDSLKTRVVWFMRCYGPSINVCNVMKNFENTSALGKYFCPKTGNFTVEEIMPIFGG